MITLVPDSLKQVEAIPGAGLQAALRAVEPGAILIPPWRMQNIVAADLGIPRTRFALQEYQIHVIARERFVKISLDEGLGLPPQMPEVDTLVLLARPELDWLDSRPLEQALRHYWRLLFRSRLVQEIRRKLAAAGEPAVQVRIEAIGRGAFNEAKFVLDRDHSLPPGAGDADTYAEFAAVWLELHYFHPELLKIFFPSLTDIAAVLAALSGDVDAEAALRQTQLVGAGPARVEPEPDEVPKSESAEAPADKSAAAQAEKAEKAAKAAKAGNIVRAAIFRQRAATPGQARVDAARHDAAALVARLTPAIRLDEQAAGKWTDSLAELVLLVADAWWTQEDRLLYDLQKVCVNYEREMYSVGVVDWLLGLCRRPLRRPQPNQRIVLIYKALHSALDRIPRVRLNAAGQDGLTHLIHHAMHGVEAQLRDALRPAMTQSLRTDDLVPQNAPERVAENKLVEDLLDGVIHRGYLTLSSVRDAIANNQIKFKDIPGPGSFLRGDPLFRIDRRLADSLDGVYHRGEIYLRLFQRGSSVLFATLTGRFITRTLLMPLIFSYIIIAGLDHTVLELARVVTGSETTRIEPLANFAKHEQSPAASAADHHRVLKPAKLKPPAKPLTRGEIVFGNTVYGAVAVLLLGVLNWAAFRRLVARGFIHLFRAIGFIFYGAPKWVFDRPAVRAFFDSRQVRLLLRYVGKPLAFALIGWLVCRHDSPRVRWSVAAAVFVVMNVLLNNPAGRALEQEMLHWFRAVGGRITNNILMNVLSAIHHFFTRRLEEFDRMLYAVDEWLRFRAGQPKSSLYFKAILGIFWFYIAYVSRFVVNLLVEPQVNPIKHFPVVTVSHKIILPQVVHLSAVLEPIMPAADTAAFLIVASIPGIFGFLAWELGTNWKLYRANRAPGLKPVMVGSHGESIARLIRPGFHSGTIPKIFARLRKAYRKSDELNNPAATKPAELKFDESIEHVGDAVAHFVERELLALVNQHPAWSETPISLTAVNLFVTGITADLSCPALSGEPMRIFFEVRGGWILAGIEQAGWAANMPKASAPYFCAALLGLYKKAGVDLVKEQIESLFAPTPIAFEVTREKLIVWPDRQFDKEMFFHLNDEEATAPQKFTPQQLLLSRVSIPWNDWVNVWSVPDRAVNDSVAIPAPKLPGICVLSA